MDLATFLMAPEALKSENSSDSVLEPTAENLDAALGRSTVETANHLHRGARLNFVIRAMSSDGYTALDNVTTINPMTGFPMTTPAQDARERQIIFLMYGVSQPPMTRQRAERMLDHPGWGPGNIALIDAIKELNPSAEERINNFILLMQANRFNTILFYILDEIGALDDICDKYNVTDNVRIALKMCISSFTQLFKFEYAAEAWGIPLNIEGIVNFKKPEELEESAEVPEEKEDETSDTEEVNADDTTEEHKEDSPRRKKS